VRPSVTDRQRRSLVPGSTAGPAGPPVTFGPPPCNKLPAPPKERLRPDQEGVPHPFWAGAAPRAGTPGPLYTGRLVVSANANWRRRTTISRSASVIVRSRDRSRPSARRSSWYGTDRITATDCPRRLSSRTYAILIEFRTPRPDLRRLDSYCVPFASARKRNGEDVRTQRSPPARL
jgi:hypothetical protein